VKHFEGPQLVHAPSPTLLLGVDPRSNDAIRNCRAAMWTSFPDTNLSAHQPHAPEQSRFVVAAIPLRAGDVSLINNSRPKLLEPAVAGAVR